MQSEIDILRDVSRRFESAGMEYMLTGSMAMNYYAQPRMTRDIDIVVDLKLEAADTIVRLFSPEYYISLEAVKQSVRNRSLFNLIHQESVIKVDCVVRKDSPYRRAEFDRRLRVPIDGFHTWIVTKEDLVLSKLDWAKDSLSERQFSDIRNLLESGCDLEYVSHWVQQLGLAGTWNKVIHE